MLKGLKPDQLRQDGFTIKLSGIAQNSERFKSFAINTFNFLDSLNYWGSSLDSITGTLRESNHDFKLIKQVAKFQTLDIKLLTSKLTFPYSHFHSIEEMRLCKTFPPPEAFFSELSASPVNEETYERARQTFIDLRCQSMLEFAQHYVRLDTVLLAEAVMSLREQTYKNYGLELGHFISIPSLTMETFLLTTKPKIELMQDLEMLNFLRTNLRGGYANAITRHVEEGKQFNLKYYEDYLENVDEERLQDAQLTKIIEIEPQAAANPLLSAAFPLYRESTSAGRNRLLKAQQEREQKEFKQMFIYNTPCFTDVTALYSYAMLSSMPVGDYVWIEKDEDIKKWGKSEIMALDANSDTGYIFEVSLYYPPHLSYDSLHNMFPLCPQTMEITESDLSDYNLAAMKLAHGFDLDKQNFRYRSKKLVTSLSSKERYAVHYRNLSFYLGEGIEISKIFRILKFTQAPVIKPYVEKLMHARANTNNAVESSLMKLLSNSLYGKFFESSAKHVQLKFCTSPQDMRMAASKSKFKRAVIINPRLAFALNAKPAHDLRRPIQFAFVILELAKLRMYEILYKTMRPAFPFPHFRICMTDTDSLLTTSYVDSEKQMKNLGALNYISDIMDTSNFDNNHPLYDIKNKKVCGLLKSEVGSNRITEAVALKAKNYCVTVVDSKSSTPSEKIAIKGINRFVARKEQRMSMYKNALKSFKPTYLACQQLQSHNFNIYRKSVSKKAISSGNDKVWILPCGKHSLSLGHSAIMNIPKSDLMCVHCQRDQKKKRLYKLFIKYKAANKFLI